jgi:hypothetical protein
MTEIRKCIVKGNLAGFHMWSDKSVIVPPSPLMGGHNGGVRKFVVGIVEYEDGTIHECYPNEIRFIDGFGKPKYAFNINGKEV